MNRVTVDMNNLVRDVQARLAPDFDGRSIRFDVRQLEPVEGDPMLLRLAMENLLSNAIKYTRSRANAVIEIGSTTSAAEVCFFVRDNGVGFDMKYYDKLFGVFQRLHRMEDFEGTGIGLANVRRIIARHGGRTWAEGAVDQGATFWFALPKRHGDTAN
jgi:light-regulated signal transduction histidine kinase (bacteriophytochrome)